MSRQHIRTLLSGETERLIAWVYAPFIVMMLAVLALTVWATWMLCLFPYAGVAWSPRQGDVASVDEHGPAARAGVLPGAKVLAVDEVALTNLDTPYNGKGVGERVTLTVMHEHQLSIVTLRLISAPLSTLIIRLEPVLVSVVYSALSFWIWALQPFHHLTRLFFLLSQTMAGMLLFGALSTIHVTGSALLFRMSLLLLSPLILHFYTWVPTPQPPQRRIWLLRLGYGGAVVGGLLSLGYSFHLGNANEPFSIWVTRRSIVALTLVAALSLLLHHPPSFTHTLRRRVVIAGMIFSLAPLLFLSFLPELVWGTPLLDYPSTFPFLVLLPVFYARVVVCQELGRFALFLSRSIVLLILGTLLLFLYVGLFWGLGHFLPTQMREFPFIGAGLTVLFVIFFPYLRVWVQQRVDHLFYGGWYDYRTVVREAHTHLRQAPDLAQLSEQVFAIVSTMRFPAAVLLWRIKDEFRPTTSFGYNEAQLQHWQLPADSLLAHGLCDVAELRLRAQLVKALPADLQTLTDIEQQLLTEDHLDVWLPLISRGILRGVLVMAERTEEMLLDFEDIDILETVAAQAGLAAENVSLVDSLRMQLAEVEQIRDELAEAQRRLSEGREAERLHLAQELHDGPVQDLYGVRFQLNALHAALPKPVDLEPIQRTLVEVIGMLRTLCSELRPPVLAPFGLAPTIRAHAVRVQEAHPELDVQVDMMHDGQLLDESTRLGLFRIYQECMNNVVKHAQAQQVVIRLRLDVERVVLEVRDDGRGYQIPKRWIELARHGHLGMIGIVERVQVLNGTLKVTSAPDQGTCVHVTVPRLFPALPAAPINEPNA